MDLVGLYWVVVDFGIGFSGCVWGCACGFFFKIKNVNLKNMIFDI